MQQQVKVVGLVSYGMDLTLYSWIEDSECLEDSSSMMDEASSSRPFLLRLAVSPS